MKGDTRSLDYSTHGFACLLREGNVQLMLIVQLDHEGAGSEGVGFHVWGLGV